MGKNNLRLYYLLSIILTLLGLAVTILLTFSYYAKTETLLDAFCSIDSFFDCSKMKKGQFSAFLGIPVSLWGLQFYLMVSFYLVYSLIKSKYKKKNLLIIPFFWLLIFAVAIDLLLLFISLFFINGLCTNCLFVYIDNIAILITFYLYQLKNRNILTDTKNFSSSLLNKKIVRHEFIMLIGFSFINLILIYLFGFTTSHQTKLIEKKSNIQIANAVKTFYNKPIQKINLPKAQNHDHKSRPVHVVIFHDLQCPHCQQSFYDLRKLQQKYPSQLRLSYLNFAFIQKTTKSDIPSFKLAQYSLVANDANKYADFLDTLFQKFERKEYIHQKKIYEIFNKIGIQLTPDQLDKRCQEKKSVIAKQKTMANEMNINRTPSIFINGRRLRQHNKHIIEKIIELELSNNNKKELVRDEP